VANWAPNIVPPWSTTDLESILSDALRVLGEIGIECKHEVVRARLAERGGVSFAGDRVCFAEQPLRDHLEQRRSEIAVVPIPATTPFSLDSGFAALNYCDPETQDVRPATTAEAVQMVRFWDSREYKGVVPLIPGDVPPGMVTLAAERIALQNSRHLGGGLTVTDPEEIRFLIDMDLAAGKRYRLTEQIGISPLRFNDAGLESALAFSDNPDVDLSIDGYIPIVGATCPLDPRSAVVQSAAETLAFDALCAALNMVGGSLITRAEPFDFQYGAIVFGSAEWCLYRILVIQMSEFLTGQPVRKGVFRSVSKRPDAQASCERTASVLWQALFGVRRFGATGQLSVDEVFSPQQAILDSEILGYVERVIDGLPITHGAIEQRDVPVDPVELIREGIEQGSFTGVADTVNRFRDLCYFPEIFRHWNVGRWKSEGSPSVLSGAWDQAKREIARSDYELEASARADVERIYRRAEDYMGGKS
jgi:trimethylamine:corrinoid methyltransferase-like protein